MEASNNNDFAHQVGLTTEEVVSRYTTWAKDYEKDLCEENFQGPRIIANSLSRLFPARDDPSSVRVLDVAAGTGFVGEKLKYEGFQNIDGLEPSEGMMEVLKTKNIYRNTFLEYLDENDLSIPQDSYDVVVISGGLGEGHIPCIGIRQLARVAKPGGYVLIAMREMYLQTVTEYKDRLEPLMRRMEDEGLWKMQSRDVIPRYSFQNNGILYIFKVIK